MVVMPLILKHYVFLLWTLIAVVGCAPAGSTRLQEADELDRRVAQAERQRLTQPAATTQEAFDYDLGISLSRLAAARLRDDSRTMSKYFFAEGDDGSLVLARCRRRLALDRLFDAAREKIGNDTISISYLYSGTGDDLYGIAMHMWTVGEDRATGSIFADQSAPDVKLRKIDGVWRIDVSDESSGDPKVAARRAQEETRKLQRLTEDLKRLKFKTADELKNALEASGIERAGNPH